MVWKHDVVTLDDGKPRCGWVSDDPLYRAYHDTEWGRPHRDPHKLFELLILEGCQAGLSWITVLRKREHYRTVYDGFDPAKIARYTPKKLDKLTVDPGIVRHRGKIDASVGNAKAWLALAEREDPVKFLWSFAGGKPMVRRPKTLKDVPAQTVESAAMSKALTKLGFRFVGSTICYAFMQATGMVDDHVAGCHCVSAPSRSAPAARR
jgi:DNA-3-methyladenine glycosylase I